jgi:hypothetical protein
VPTSEVNRVLQRAQAVFNDPTTTTDPSFQGWTVSFQLNGKGAERFAGAFEVGGFCIGLTADTSSFLTAGRARGCVVCAA